MVRSIVVEHTERLNGTVRIPGSKNSSLALMAAACLADEPVTLLGIPYIADFRIVRDLCLGIGAQFVRKADGSVYIDPRPIHQTCLDPKQSSAIRTAYYFVGALLAKFGKVTVGYPGGDDFVSRPIDQHIKALQQLGAKFTFHEDYYEVEARELKGTTIYFDTVTSGGTINSILAAVRAKGRTVLQNAARDPEVTDTANFLNQMGAKIYGAGTDTIRIEGVSHLHGCTYSVIPDRLIAGTFLIAAGVTGGTVTVQDVIPEHLGSCIAKLREVGVEIVTGDHSVTACSDGKIRATRIRTGMYPGFPTDLQQPFTALLTQASGKSIISERVYPNRFNHIYPLKRMGADIEVRSGVAYIQGKSRLKGTLVHAPDIRAGISLVLAGLAAEGTTIITGIHHIERGYENAAAAFASIGANISVQELADQSGFLDNELLS